jgi:ubiquitin-protein ligase
MSTSIAGAASGGAGRREFTRVDRLRLLNVMARLYNTQLRAETFLEGVGFPAGLVPGWQQNGTPTDYWNAIFQDLDRGVMQDPYPYHQFLEFARATYVSNRDLTDLHHDYSEPQQNGSQQPQNHMPAADANTSHVVAWLDSPEQRTDLQAWLAERGLDPELEWATPTSASFRVNQRDPGAVTSVMDQRRDLHWTVVRPGVPDYVLRDLMVQGPDGRSFRFSDVPSATTVGQVAGEMVGQYEDNGGPPGAERPTVVEHVGPDGPRRMNPDATLAEEGVTEGERLRVGWEQRAAAVNPLDRDEALLRVMHQLEEYEETHPGFSVAANSAVRPTEYEIEFTQESFGPPDVGGGEPPDIAQHQVSIILPADFPLEAPQVRWLTPIYHPNVWPNYESAKYRENKYAHGVVCLGTLSESYQPSMDFGELCDTLVAIAGYRNYSVYEAGRDAAGRPNLHGDFYDPDAAQWALSFQGQERILRIKGAPVFRALIGRPARLGLEVERYEEEDETAP